MKADQFSGLEVVRGWLRQLKEGKNSMPDKRKWM